MELINKQDFKNYLKAMEPGDIAGTRMDCGFCPLARWLGADVGTTTIEWDGGENTFVPVWMSRFIAKVDSHTPCESMQVTVSECLETLEMIEEE